MSLETVNGLFAMCHRSNIEDRIITKSCLKEVLKGGIDAFSLYRTNLNKCFIIDIDSDVDYRLWSKLETWIGTDGPDVDDDICEVLQRLLNTLREIADTIDARYGDDYYERLFHNQMHGPYACNGTFSVKEYELWKKRHPTGEFSKGSLECYVGKLIVNLLRSYVFEGIESNASRQQRKEYLEEIDLDTNDPVQMRKLLDSYCCFKDIYDYTDGRYTINKANAGRLIFMLRKEPEKVQALANFDHLLNLINADIDSLRNNSRTHDNTPYEKQTRPQDCRDAVGRVMTDTFTVQPSGTVLNSRQQLVQAAGVVDTGSGAQLAMLKAIAVELKAVKPGCSRPDFVKALIGLGIISPTDKEGIERLANGIKKKENGRTHKGERPSPLSPNHRSWEIKDSEIGNKIYDIMRMRCN